MMRGCGGTLARIGHPEECDLLQPPRSRTRRGVDPSKQRILTRVAIALGVLLAASGGVLVSPLGQAFGVATLVLAPVGMVARRRRES